MSVSITAPLAAAANPAAALGAGGSLTVSTTYYYRIVALKKGLGSSSYTGPYGAELWGLPCTEVSATPTSGNQTINLTWDVVVGATGYEVYRTEVSGDYDPNTSHLLNDPTIREDMYASTNTNSFSDDGAQEINYCLFLENGLPMAVLTGSTEGSPDDENDIYDALIAGGYTNHTSRVGGQDGNYYFSYHFLCNIDIQGWFTVNKGKHIFHEGSLKFGANNAGWSVGAKSGTRPYHGSAYIRKFVYTNFANNTTNTIKLYNSFIKDLNSEYAAGNTRCGAWNLVYYGKFYCENSVIAWNALQTHGDAEGYILGGSLNIGMQSSAKIFMNNNQYTYIYSPFYCYYANQNPVIKNLIVKDQKKDIRFHKSGDSVYLDVINYAWPNDPPTAVAVYNPTNLTVRDKYEFGLKITDIAGNAITGATIKIVDNLSNEIAPEEPDTNGEVFITSGTATSGGGDTLTDTGKAWTVNGLADYIVEIYEGTGSGQEKSILSNTATAMTVKGDWETAPNNTSKYRLKMHIMNRAFAGKAASPYYDTTTYTPHTIEIKKAGYKTYKNVFTLDKKSDWIVALKHSNVCVDQEVMLS